MSEPDANIDLPLGQPSVGVPELAPCHDRAEDEDLDDQPIGRVQFPVLKVVKATFIYAGKLKLKPIPNLD